MEKDQRYHGARESLENVKRLCKQEMTLKLPVAYSRILLLVWLTLPIPNNYSTKVI